MAQTKADLIGNSVQPYNMKLVAMRNEAEQSNGAVTSAPVGLLRSCIHTTQQLRSVYWTNNNSNSYV